MTILLISLFFLGVMMMGLKLSMMEQQRFAVVAGFAMGAITLPVLPWSVNLSSQQIVTVVENNEIISIICLIQAAEALATLVFTTSLLHAHYTGKKRPVIRLIVLFPNMVLLAGLLILQVHAVNIIPWRSFLMIGLAHTLVVTLVLISLMFVFVKLIRIRLLRFNIMLSIAFFQLMLAMILPLIAQGLETPDSGWTIELISTITTVMSMIALVFIGYGLRSTELFRRIARRRID